MRRVSIPLGVLLAIALAVVQPALAQRQGGRATPRAVTGRRGGRGAPPRGVVARQIMNRLSREDQDQVRMLSLQLHDALLELNRLRRIQAGDPQSESIRPMITARADDALKLSARIYAIVESNGMAAAIVDQSAARAIVMQAGLSASETALLEEVGFSAMEIADISTEIKVRGDALVQKIGPVDQRKRIESTAATDSVVKTARISGGVLLIGFDAGSRFIPMLNAVTAMEAVTSIAEGMDMVAEGLELKPPSQ